MKTTKYYRIGSGASSNVVRVKYEGNRPIEFEYLNLRTGEWDFDPSIVDDVIMGDAEEITSPEAEVVIAIRSAEPDPEQFDESPTKVAGTKGKKSNKFDLPTVALEDDGEEDTDKNYHVSETPGLLYPGIIDADDYQADKPQWLVDMKAAMTPEEVYERDLAHGGYRNLVMEKDLDLSKIDPELLKNAKVWIDLDGNYHPEILGPDDPDVAAERKRRMKMTPEEEYEDYLRAGFSRDSFVEAELDLNKVDPKLLAKENPLDDEAE